MSLVAQYRLSETSGTTVADNVGSNDGTWQGAESVTNGAMTNLTGWTQTGSDYLWNGGSSRCDYAQQGSLEDRILSQDVSGVSGERYDVSVDIVVSVAGTLSISLGLGSTPTVISGVAIHTFSAVWGGSDSTLYIEGSGAGDLSFKDVSIRKQVDSVDSPVNRGLLFDGTGDNITVPNDASLNTGAGLTIMCRAKPTNTDSLGVMITKTAGAPDGYRLDQSTDGSGLWRFRTWIAGAEKASSSDVPPTGQWQHITGVQDDSGNMILYVDGIAQADLETNAGNPDNIGTLNIGFRSSGVEHFDGSISDVRIYDTALTASQIKQIWNEGAAKGYRGRNNNISPGRPLDRTRSRY